MWTPSAQEPHVLLYVSQALAPLPRPRQELPESPVNRDLGVFQVTATLLTSTGDVVAKSSRPAQLRYRSLLARGVRAAARAPLLAVDAAREAQVVTVPLFEGACVVITGHQHTQV